MSRLLLISLLIVHCLCACNKLHKTNATSTTDAKLKTMDPLQQEVATEIVAFVKSGFYDKKEIFENIQDMFYEETLNDDWLQEEIEKQYNLRLAEQTNWEAITDFDRLVQVFDQLNTSGIIALHKAGYTRQDGEDDSQELHEELKAKGIITKGYCFYHGQDMDRAIEGGKLYLAFGDFEGNDQLGVHVGQQIVTALHKQGFKTNWNNSIETRIEVVGIKWQKRFGNENCSTEKALSLLSKH